MGAYVLHSIWRTAYQADCDLLRCHLRTRNEHVCVYTPNTNHTVVTVLARLCELLKATTEIQWKHEPSHEGLPFNEFADVGSKAQRKLHDTAAEVWSPASSWAVSNPEYASLAFLYAADHAVLKSYPIKVVDGDLFLSATVHPVSEYKIPSAIVMAHIDDYHEDDLIAATNIVAAQL